MSERSSDRKPRIYCFISGQWGGGDLVVIALAEDGVCLAQHVSSSEGWAKRDIGFVETPGPGTSKRALYAEHYPDGYELEWVEDLGAHDGFRRATERNLTAPKQGEPPSKKRRFQKSPRPGRREPWVKFRNGFWASTSSR